MATAVTWLVSRLSLFLFLVLRWVIAENVTSHKYVDPKGNSSFEECFPNSAYSFPTLLPNWVSGVLEYRIFSPLSVDTSIRVSCSLAGILLFHRKWNTYPVQFGGLVFNAREI